MLKELAAEPPNKAPSSRPTAPCTSLLHDSFTNCRHHRAKTSAAAHPNTSRVCCHKQTTSDWHLKTERSGSAVASGVALAASPIVTITSSWFIAGSGCVGWGWSCRCVAIRLGKQRSLGIQIAQNWHYLRTLGPKAGIICILGSLGNVGKDWLGRLRRRKGMLQISGKNSPEYSL